MTNHPARVREQDQQVAAAHLGDVADIVRDATAVQRALLERAVLRSRLEGRSWSLIGRDLGVTRQAARQRWKHVEDTPGGVVIRMGPDGVTLWSEALEEYLFVEDQVLAVGTRRLHELAERLATVQV